MTKACSKRTGNVKVNGVSLRRNTVDDAAHRVEFAAANSRARRRKSVIDSTRGGPLEVVEAKRPRIPIYDTGEGKVQLLRELREDKGGSYLAGGDSEASMT